MPFKVLLEEFAWNEIDDIELYWMFAGALVHIFEVADTKNYEEDFGSLRKIFENFLLKDDKIIL